MGLTLRGYQQRSLDALAAYFRAAGQEEASAAFTRLTGRPYLATPDLPGLPYVCLRVPTGGGKTLMACHAVGLAAKELLRQERALCLWLVPSNAILDQTLAALRDRAHPYRQALDAAFGGLLQVMTLAEALYVQRGTLDGETCVIVSTLAALRVEDTEGRKVYEESGALQHHFTRVPEGVGAALERRESGSYVCSLANVFRMRRPVIIMDEAHNARTPLSFTTLARFHPSCIVEFTATPETRSAPSEGRLASNVLHHVSASELKAEQMIKLPIKLTTSREWRDSVAGALETRRVLERTAETEMAKGGEYLRPLILFQAQPHHQDREAVTVEVLKRCLMEDFKISEAEIAVATGQVRELEDVNLLARECPIRYIITMSALKEGWDCSFAYVLCSVADLGAQRAVEQILGRVLRLPGARRKSQEALNCAYAFVASPRFAEAALALTDALVENGFQRFEANASVMAPDRQGTLFDPDSLFARASVQVSQPPDLTKLDPVLRPKVTYDPAQGLLTIVGPLKEAVVQAVGQCFTRPADRQAVVQLQQDTRGHAVGREGGTRPPPVIAIPWLAIRVNGQLELFEDTHFLDAEWSLASCEARLSEAEFPDDATPVGESGQVDVDDTGQIRFIQDLQQQFTLLFAEPGWTVPTLVGWLDRKIVHPDIPQPQSAVFIHRAVTHLMEGRGLTLDQLARRKFPLRDALTRKIGEHRLAQARREYQRVLFSESPRRIEVSPTVGFALSEDRYAPSAFYEGPQVFHKHAFRLISEMNDEEAACAAFLDELPNVRVWIRNVDQRSDSSFWLQTSTDRFYPDFIAVLQDGRYLVVEYKNERDWSNEDSEEKRALGTLWAERSNGRCLFVMPKGLQFSEITNVIVGSPRRNESGYPMTP